jgi:triosephosphate isomerase
MRQKIVAGNWKMNLDYTEGLALFNEVSDLIKTDITGTQHSERRQYFGESNDLLAKKTDTVLKYNLRPIFCIGETLQEREAGQHFDIIKSQLVEGVFHLDAAEFAKLVIAYEPVWAIGTGVTASAEQAQEIHAFIRKEVAAKYGADVADGITILYGGSCNPKNAPELFDKPDIDGGLIGGASLKARDFVDILKVWN